MKRLLALFGLVCLGALLLGGCGGDDDAGGGGGKGFNAQDVSFARDMIPHHQQAVEMSDLVPSRSQNPKVIALAAQIKQAQAPEITTMTGFLTTFGEPLDGGGSGGHGGHGGGGAHSGMGMVSDEDLAKLRSASGTEFDRLFLTQMTAHHEGAIDMARAEMSKGEHPPAKDLAQQIATSQEKEISEMKSLLAGIA